MQASAKKLALPTVSADIDFRDVEFKGAIFFEKHLFSRNSWFSGAAFSDYADFRGATFSGWADFESAAFSVSEVADFGGAGFLFFSNFKGAAFYATDFRGAAFSSRAFFNGATFSGEASFAGATFSGPANFGKAALGEGIRVTSFGRAASFVNAEMKGGTSFEEAIFKTEPPRFFGAKLHQGTVWRGTKPWPLPKDKKEAGAFIDAYACLKLEMDRLKKHEDELKFFAFEMQSRRVELGTWKGLPYAIYGVLSNYGRSYVRPLVALFVVAAIGAGAFWYFDTRDFWSALGLSAANTLNVFGFRRDFSLAIDTPFAWLKVFAAVQTILGTILLFLFGLGIRNKFRMK